MAVYIKFTCDVFRKIKIMLNMAVFVNECKYIDDIY